MSEGFSSASPTFKRKQKVAKGVRGWVVAVLLFAVVGAALLAGWEIEQAVRSATAGMLDDQPSHVATPPRAKEDLNYN